MLIHGISTLRPGLLTLVLCLPLISPAAPTDWPQWRGPMGTGVAPQGHPPTEWSETKNIQWKVKIPGEGTATPVVSGDRVFIQAAIPTGKKAEPVKTVAREIPAFGQVQRPEGGGPPGGEGQPRRRGPGGPGMRNEKPTETYQFVLLCLDRKSGKTLWQKVAAEAVPHEGHHPSHSFASHSPVTDGKLVFAYFGSRGLHCYDVDGNLKWEKDLGRMQTKMGFGEGSSPVLHGDSLVINWDHEGDDFIVAFDKNTGKERWRTARDEETSWSTPVVVENEGKAQVVVAATRKIRSYDLETGKQLWECAGLTPNTIPTPLPGKGVVYLTSGFRGNALLAIKLGRTGDLTGTDSVLWKYEKSTPYVPSPLLYGDRIYFLASNNGILSCVSAVDGKALIDAERLEGISDVYASLVGASDHVYVVGRNGTAVVLKNSGKMEIAATNKLEDKIDSSPAIAGNQLFLRGHDYLYCIAEK